MNGEGRTEVIPRNDLQQVNLVPICNELLPTSTKLVVVAVVEPVLEAVMLRKNVSTREMCLTLRTNRVEPGTNSGHESFSSILSKQAVIDIHIDLIRTTGPASIPLVSCQEREKWHRADYELTLNIPFVTE
jgi:hypothetical protein